MTTDSRTVEPTSGPWVVTRGRSPDARMVFVDGPDGQIICDCYTSHGEANAKLIAAAPEMEAELDYIVRYFEGGIMPLDLREWKRRAVAALKKAEGRA